MPAVTRWATAIAATMAITVCAAPAASAASDPSPAGANDFACQPTAERPNPVVLVHGLGATMAANWGYHSPRLKAAGYCVFALTYGVDSRSKDWPYSPGGVVPMERSAPELQSFVDRVLEATGASRVDLVGHSEGTVMPRYYLERLGGADKVERFVALTPLWRGTEVFTVATLREVFKSYGLSTKPGEDTVGSMCGSCPQFLRGSDYLQDLNADGEAVPGIEHTNIVTRYDVLVTPYTSGIMRDGGTNIVLQDVCPADVQDHSTLALDPIVTQLILNGLDPDGAKPVDCGGVRPERTLPPPVGDAAAAANPVDAVARTVSGAVDVVTGEIDRDNPDSVTNGVLGAVGKATDGDVAGAVDGIGRTVGAAAGGGASPAQGAGDEEQSGSDAELADDGERRQRRDRSRG